jgi:hypothetical protein
MAGAAGDAGHPPDLSPRSIPCLVDRRHGRLVLGGVVAAYGPRRVFWGTDLTRLSCPYRQAVTLFTQELDFLSDEDKEWIMGGGIAEWLDWPLPRN